MNSVEQFITDYVDVEYRLRREEWTKGADYDSLWQQATACWKDRSNSIPYGAVIGELRKVHDRMLKKLKKRDLFKISHVAATPEYWWVVLSGDSTQWGDGYYARYAVGRIGGDLKILGEESAHVACRGAGCDGCGQTGFEYVRGDRLAAGPVDAVHRYSSPGSDWLPAHERDA